MLNRRSTTIARTKMVMVLPLTIACLALFSQISYSKRFDRQGNKVTYRGNTFELGNALQDTIIIVDPVTGGEITKYIKRPPMPETINGIKIYKPAELTTQPQGYTQNGMLQDYVFRKISGMLNELPDGTYDLDISSLVIDKNGKIVYYEGEGFRQYNNRVPDRTRDAIAAKIDEILYDAPAMKPGQVNGNSVTSLSYITTFANYEIEVKDHQSSLKQTFSDNK